MRKQKWNDNWLYWTEKDAFALVWDVAPDAKLVNLPYDAMLDQYAYKESPNKGNTGYRDGGVYQYSKELTPDEKDSDKVFMLYFEGVYMNAFVYVNSQLVTRHPYGYTGFYVCLNDYLKFGQKNEIRVTVRNSGMTNSRWYSGGGIYRDVYLLTSERSYLREDGTFITTESLDEEAATILIENEICNKSYGMSELYLETLLLDPSGAQVAVEKVPVTMMEGEDRKVTCRLLVDQPKAWSAEKPDLYKMVCRIYKNDSLMDEKEETFGIRVLSLDAKRGFRVNGKHVLLKGACLHHDSGIIGASTLYDAEYRRVSKLKESGFNAIRMSHHPSAPVLLKACDELGMYVMDEAFDMWDRCKSENDYGLFFDEWWEADVESMVRTAYGHPSVIMYSVGNEIPEIGTDHGAKRCHEIAEKIKSLDKTRYTLAGINGVFSIGEMVPQVVAEVVGADSKDGQDGNVNDFMAAMFGNMDKIINHHEVSKRIEKACASLDIAGYNYMTDRYEPDIHTYPNRVIVGSETYPPEIARNWEIVKKCNHVIGDFTWTGWDYIGEAGIGVPSYGGSGDGMGTPFPCQISYTGDIDITGFRRPASYFKEIVFGQRMAPYICAQRPEYYGQKPHMTPWSLTDAIESWSFNGYEGKPIQVEIYSAGDEVELFINEKSIGRQKAGEEVGYRVFFETTYEAGKIKAVSYENGKEIGSMELESAEQPAKVMTTVTNGVENELVYVDFALTDDKGRLVTEEDTLITVTPDSDVSLFVGSGNHSPLLDYKDGKTNTWNGRAQAIVRKNKNSGKVTLTVTTKFGEETITF